MGQLPYHDIPDNNQVYRLIRSRHQLNTVNQDDGEYTEQPIGQAGIADQKQLLLTISDADEAPPTTQPERQENLDLTDNKPDGTSETTMMIRNGQLNLVMLPPPLPPPHRDTPHQVYSIMCSCWATDPNDRPKFEEVVNRLYWCLQMPDILNSPLPTFAEQHSGKIHQI